MKRTGNILSFVIVYFTSVTVVTSQNIGLIKDYLTFNHIKTALFLTCESTSDVSKIVEELHNTDLYVNVLGLNSESVIVALNYTQFFVRLEGRHTVVIDLDCEHANSILKQSSQRMLFHWERSWLIFSKKISRSFDLLSQENINMDADVTLVIPLENSNYEMKDVYNPSKLRGGRLKITTIGKWDKYHGIQLSTEQTKIERRRNLGGLKFMAVLTLPSPTPNNQTFLEHIQSNEFTQINSLDRSTYKLFELMMEMHNFTVFIHRTKHWMGIDANGRWTGTLGMVQRGEVDVAITGSRQQDNRYGQIEATTHCYIVRIIFIFKHPKSVNTSNVFLSPLDDVVWLFISLFGLFIAVSLRQTFLLESERRFSDYSYGNSALMVFGILFQQGYSGSTNRLSSKLLTISVLLFAFVIFQFYSSFIISSLLIEPPKTIKTMKQLLQSKLKCFADDVPYILDNLRYAKDESAKQIYEQILNEPETRILTVQKGVDLVKKKGIVLNTDASYAYPKLKDGQLAEIEVNKRIWNDAFIYVTSSSCSTTRISTTIFKVIVLPSTFHSAILSDKEICSLQEVTYIQKIPGYPVVTVKSPLRELIKISLTKFHETGIMRHHWNIWIGKKPKCQNNFIDLVQVDWMHFSSSLYMLVVGIATSFLILLFEKLANFHYKRKSQLKDALW